MVAKFGPSGKMFACKVGMLVGLPAVSAFSFLSIGDWGDKGAKELNSPMGKFTPE